MNDKEKIIAAAKEAGCDHADLLCDIAEKIEQVRANAFAAGAASVNPEIAIAEAYRCGAASRDSEIEAIRKSVMHGETYGYGVRVGSASRDAEIAELVAALDAMHNDSDECMDFDEFTAMLVPMDNWNSVFDVLAKVRKV